MSKRCNKIIDCLNDSSDEDNCEMIEFDQTYKQEFAPIRTDTNEKIMKVKITVSVNLLRILKVAEVDSNFSCQLKLQLTWFDQRLMYNNLKSDQNYNTLSKAEMNQIWTPNLIFENTEKRDRLKTDNEAGASVIQLGNFVMAGDETLDNTFVYSGSENPITLARAYKSILYQKILITLNSFYS